DPLLRRRERREGPHPRPLSRCDGRGEEEAAFSMNGKSTKQRWHGQAETQIRARQLRREHTPAEAIRWSRLRNRQLDGFKFRRQHVIERFIVDFCCADQHLIIEIDGPVHGYQLERDQVRTEALQALGYTIIRYTNDQILHQLDRVLADLSHVLTPTDHNATSPSPAAAGEGAGG